jgi:hypothetical protein
MRKSKFLIQLSLQNTSLYRFFVIKYTLGFIITIMQQFFIFNLFLMKIYFFI